MIMGETLLLFQDYVRGTFLAVLVYLILLALRDRRIGSSSASDWILSRVGAVALLAAVSVATSVVVSMRLSSYVRFHQSHGGMFYDYGRPLHPVRLSNDQQTSLKVTYYRGNDDRDPSLPNQGYYRTADFYLSLINLGTGEALEEGALLEGPVTLGLKFELSPAQCAEREHFSKESMQRFFLSPDKELLWGRSVPLETRVRFEAGNDLRWTATVPLTKIEQRPQDGAGGNRAIEGTVILGQEIRPSSLIEDARFHYAMVYKLKVSGGKVQQGSSLWMTQLFRSPEAATGGVAPVELLSASPLPERTDCRVGVGK